MFGCFPDYEYGPFRYPGGGFGPAAAQRQYGRSSPVTDSRVKSRRGWSLLCSDVLLPQGVGPAIAIARPSCTDCGQKQYLSGKGVIKFVKRIGFEKKFGKSVRFRFVGSFFSNNSLVRVQLTLSQSNRAPAREGQCGFFFDDSVTRYYYQYGRL